MSTPATEVRAPKSANRVLRSLNTFGGLLDAGLAALSTFVMGTAVVRLLSTEDLALYSSMFAGYVLCALLPSQLVYVPSQLAANTQLGASGEVVASDVVGDLRRHFPTVLLSGLLACALGLPLAHVAGWDVFAYSTIGMFVFAVASPHQSHARSVLHVASRHAGAALVSTVTLGIQALALIPAVLAASTPSFHALVLGLVLLGAGVANLTGTAVALLLLRSVPVAERTSASFATRLGFLTSEGIVQTGGYLAVLLVAAVLGTRAVAALETARVVASPVQIFVVGLLSYLLPRAVRAVAAKNRPLFQRLHRRTNGLVALLGGSYVILLLIAGSFVGRLLGRHVDGDLAAARSAVTTIDSTGTTPSVALMSQHRVLSINVVNLVVNAATLALMPLTLLGFGTFGMPIAQGVGMGAKAIVLTVLARRLF